jgi:hypothetical protein
MIQVFAQRFVRSALLLAAAAVLLCGPTASPGESTTQQQPLTARDLNVWGRFGVGTWKEVRIVTETLNEKGCVVDTTVTDTKTTLVRADSRQLALRIDATVDVAGKRFESRPKTIECGYYGETAGDSAEPKVLGTEMVTIEGRQVACQIRQVVTGSGQQKQLVRMFLSDDVEPFVLKRETIPLKDDGNSSSDQKTTAEVIGLDLPYHVLHGIKPAAFERTIQQTTKGTNISLDVTCLDIPGGIVARASNELDEKGQVVRRSMLELVDYKIVSDNGDNDKDNPGGMQRFYSRRELRRARHGR